MVNTLAKGSVRRTPSSKQFLLAGLCVPLLLASQLTHADVSISGLDDITLDAWAGATDDLVGSDTYCTISCSGGWNDCRWPRDYDVAAYTDGATDGSGNFYLDHDTNGAAPPLLVTFEWTNPAEGTFTMSDYDTTSYTAPPAPGYAPGATSCAQTNSQNTITITLPASSLASAVAGTYSETFYIDMCRQENGFECVDPVNFIVDLPELIQITQLQDFDLGTWDASGDIQETNDFCVFRNGYGGFSVTATGDNDSGGNFRLGDDPISPVLFIPYTLEFSEGGAWYEADPNTALSSTTTGFSGDSTRNCGGGTSHSVRVTVGLADLGTSKLGSYSDTITLVVEAD